MPVNVIGTLKPKNNGKFPVAEAVDIKVKGDMRLDEVLENKADLVTLNFALSGKANNSDINSLQAQIDLIITPVTQDAEVQNARVGSDGTSYVSLKSRLDTENSILTSRIDKTESVLSDTEEVNISNYNISQYGISSTYNTWANSDLWESIFIPIDGKTTGITITANSLTNAVVAMLKTRPSSTDIGLTPDYATGSSRISISAGDTLTLYPPNDCAYLWVEISYNSTDHTPDSITKGTISIDRIESEITDLQSEVETLESSLTELLNIDTDDYGKSQYGIGSSLGTWLNNDKWETIFIPIDKYVKGMTVTAGSNYTAIAMLKTRPQASDIGSEPNYATGGSRVTINAGESSSFNIPNDCHFLWVELGYDGTDHAPDSIVEKREKTYEAQLPPIGLHTMPESEGQLNMVKRCRQLTDIKWTPAVDLPRLMREQKSYPYDNDYGEYYEGTFKAGTEYTGVPYGRANDITSYGYTTGFVGLDVSLESFISSISNAGSMLSKTSTFNLADHASTKYAVVCSAFTCYALNVSYVPTSDIPNINGLSLIGKIDDNGTRLNSKLLKLGDVLNLQSYHTAIITDIIYDIDGNVVAVELSEATVAGLADKNYSDGQVGGVCRRKGWSLEMFYTAWGDYSLYRYSKISSIPYTPSPYVNVGDEFDMYNVVNYPCMPYMGENFKYKEGYIPNTDVVIAPNLGFEYLRVFKDGTEITGSPFVVTSETEKISVGFSAAGEYTAYLCNMDNGDNTRMSYKCHWSVAT